MIPLDAPIAGRVSAKLGLRPSLAHVTVLWLLPTDLTENTIASTPEDLVEADGIEPTTSCLQSRRSPN